MTANLSKNVPPKQQVSLYLPSEILQELKSEALERGLRTSTYIGVILKDYIDGKREEVGGTLTNETLIDPQGF